MILAMDSLFEDEVAGQGDWPDTQTGAGPTGTPRDADGAQEDENMAEIARPVISPHLTLLLSVILLFPL